MRKWYFLIMSIVCVVLFAGCGSSAKLNSSAKELDVQKIETMERKELEIQQEETQKLEREDNIPAKMDIPKTFVEDSEKKYEYYLTRDELLTDIEQGIIFRINTAFQKPMCPIVTGGKWAFYVHENNIVNLEISYFNLIAGNGKKFYPYEEQVIVDVLAPNGDCAYHFERLGDEIMQDTSIREQIAVTPGEWTLQISFAYECDEARSHFKVCAIYELPSEDDIRWLREVRIGGNDADTENSKQENNVANFELTEEKKAFLAYVCKTVYDFDSNDKKDTTFWKDFLFLSYTGLWENKAEIVKVPRKDLGFDEPTVKVSLEEAQSYARLVFGEELPDFKPAFDETTEGQTSFFYEDGYYYIGTSDFPNFQYYFADCTVCEGEGGAYAVVEYNIDFEGENNVGVVRLTLVPAENENGFVVVSKKQEFFSEF